MEQPDLCPKLARAIAARMEVLRIAGPSELARRAHVSVQGLGALLRGERKNYQKRLTWPVCDALDWRRDSIDRLLAGKSAILADEADETKGEASADAEPSVVVYATAADLEVIRARLEEIATQASEAKKLADAASLGIQELLHLSNEEKKAGKAPRRDRRGNLGNVGS